MRTTIKLSIFLITILFTVSCLPGKKLEESGNTIAKLSSSNPATEGSLVYGLPRTVFTVFVEMERTIEKPGPYAKFAGDLLGLDKVILNETESWAIERVRVKSQEELDPSEFYMIDCKNVFLTNVLALRREGLILDLNPSESDHLNGFSVSTQGEDSQSAIYDLGSDEYYLLQRDTAYKRVTVDSMFIRIPYIVEKKKKLAVDQLAERAARKLIELREGKHLILTGEANVFPQSDAAINEINRMEKEYIELFAGKSFKEVRTFSLQIIPKKEMAGKPVSLFRFSELTGPLTGSVKGGIPVTIELTPEQKTKDLTLVVNQSDEPDIIQYDKLYYRVPDMVNLKITMGSEILFNSRKLVYQFGDVIQMPSNYLIGK